MSNKIFLFDQSNHCNYSYLEEFINSLKYEFSIKNNKDLLLNEFINDLHLLEDKLIKNFINNSKNIKYVQIAFMKKILQTWINNIDNFNKNRFESLDIYYSQYDIFYIVNENEDIPEAIIYDGDESCDLSLNLIFVHLIIKHLLYLIQDHFKDYSIICNKIFKNFRIGIYLDFRNDNYNDLITYSFNENKKIYQFFIDYKIKFNLTCFKHSSVLINNEIKLKLPWILSCIHTIFINENIIDLNTNYYPVLLNIIDTSDLYLKIENNFNYYVDEIKNFKDIIFNLYNNKIINSTIIISKRLLSKERKKRNSKL